MAGSDIRGHFDSFEGGIARGWAFDAAHPGRVVTLHVIIDRQEVDKLDCDAFRADVAHNLNHPTGLIGFEYAVPKRYADNQPHEIGFRLPTREILGRYNPSNPDQADEKVAFTIAPYAIQGFVDGLNAGKLRGWVVKQPYDGGPASGACQVRVMSGGREVATVRADRHRRDVAAALNCDPNCGFEIAVPANYSRSREHTFHFHVVPDNVEIENSPLVTSLASDELVRRLARVADQMTGLFREFADLRKQVDMLLPDVSYSLGGGGYDAWAREYYAALTARVTASRDATRRHRRRSSAS